MIVRINHPPIASFKVSNSNPKIYEEVLLDGFESWDQDEDDNNNLTYVWFGCSRWDRISAPLIYYYWNYDGEKKVQLEIIDPYGLSSIASKNVDVTKKWYQWGGQQKIKNMVSPEELERIINTLEIRSWDSCYDMDMSEFEKKELRAILHKSVDNAQSEYTYIQKIATALGEMDMIEKIVTTNGENVSGLQSIELFYGSSRICSGTDCIYKFK